MPAETDKFIVATFALWAGDFDYCAELLREFSSLAQTPALGGDVEIQKPEDFIRRTAALRLRQLRQKRGEFRKLVAEYARQGVDVTDKPILLETKHLRATIWRTGEREFLLQGYLKELGWQQSLFERARREASRREPVKSVAPQARDVLPPGGPEGEPTKRLGVTWVMPQNPFIQVELTDLGLLEATALWTEPRLPEHAEAIKEPFLKLLKQLDEPLASSVP